MTPVHVPTARVCLGTDSPHINSKRVNEIILFVAIIRGCRFGVAMLSLQCDQHQDHALTLIQTRHGFAKDCALGFPVVGNFHGVARHAGSGQ